MFEKIWKKRFEISFGMVAGILGSRTVEFLLTGPLTETDVVRFLFELAVLTVLLIHHSSRNDSSWSNFMAQYKCVVSGFCTGIFGSLWVMLSKGNFHWQDAVVAMAFYSGLSLLAWLYVNHLVNKHPVNT